MTRTRTGVRLLAAGGALAAAACTDASGPIAPNATTGTPSFQATAQGVAPDQRALARAIPGFGGVFLDESGVPTVYLTDQSQRGAAERALTAFARQNGFSPSELRVLRGDFDYLQLDDWFARVSPAALAVDGAVFVDLDEAGNRVLVGVTSGAAASVRAALARLDVPSSAVVLREVEPIHFAATLRDLVRPTVAGLQINFGQYACSIGFNALAGGVPSFITASHCTNRQGGVEGTQYYQPLSSTAGSFIGTEVADPVYFKGGVCPPGKKCRYSDASRAQYASGVPSNLAIAQTTGVNSNSLTIAGSFAVTGESGGPTYTINSTVNKVGRTTGWTSGRITNTCVNTGVSGSNIVLLCQTFVSAGVGAGDSGSGVFFLSGSNASIAGILWGGNSSGTQFVFSPLAQVEQELGPLTTF
jgi:hypothetical protein